LRRPSLNAALQLERETVKRIEPLFEPVGPPPPPHWFLREVFSPFLDAPPDRPFVAAQIGQSLDGRIATVSGESRDINGAAALDHLHRLRAHVDAVVIGAGAIAADDPQLTVRRVAGPNPARVVIDPAGRLSATGKWLKEDGARRILIRAAKTAAPAGVETLPLEARDGVIAPRAIVDALFALGLRRLLVEGGARTLKGFVEAGCVDRLHVLVAPVIIGSGLQGLNLAPVDRLDHALRPSVKAHLLEGGDVLFDCDLSSNARVEGEDRHAS
jgi:diaminohydroxyphosphoribosylaminopyrimidine deaminase / 5-amino-6-(5-phosphoribosylamino)uracil reductase